MALNLTTTNSVSTLEQIGPYKSRLLSKLDIKTVGDLLYYFPAYYKDTENIVHITDLNNEFKQTIKAQIEDIQNIRLRGGKSIQKAVVSDSSGKIVVIWFNQKYLTEVLYKGLEVYFFGKLDDRKQLSNPEYDIAKDNNVNLNIIAPIYRLTAGITTKWLRLRIFNLLGNIDYITDLKDLLPIDIKDSHDLIDLKDALKNIHFPKNRNLLINARKRLAFEELLNIYLTLINKKAQREEENSPKIEDNTKIVKTFIKQLPFKLTKSQLHTIKEISKDLKQSVAMNRLLQGDVGSGKTIVAICAALEVLESGYQVIFLVPTTVLAEQHYNTIKNLLKNKYSTLLLTNSTKKSEIKNKSYQIIVSTHSILFNKELIHNLGLLIIDEQHKFGVEQKEELINLRSADIIPHLLNLTATPIPRSVALTLFGEIDVSSIEKPEGRKTTKTFVLPEFKRNDLLKWLKEKIENGSQVFWICPLIEDSENDLTSIMTLAKDIKSYFKDLNIGTLHGKLKSAEKNKIVNDFLDKKYSILVSTTVVEVGIDIKDADIIIIENADRFGLAQLHQLRGRVGRNNQDSWCYLFTKLEDNVKCINRLNYFSKENSGIKIAEYDLKTRGPGEVYGVKQSGIPNLKIADFGNAEFLLEVREAAKHMYNITKNGK